MEFWKWTMWRSALKRLWHTIANSRSILRRLFHLYFVWLTSQATKRIHLPDGSIGDIVTFYNHVFLPKIKSRIHYEKEVQHFSQLIELTRDRTWVRQWLRIRCCKWPLRLHFQSLAHIFSHPPEKSANRRHLWPQGLWSFTIQAKRLRPPRLLHWAFNDFNQAAAIHADVKMKSARKLNLTSSSSFVAKSPQKSGVNASHGQQSIRPGSPLVTRGTIGWPLRNAEKQ